MVDLPPVSGSRECAQLGRATSYHCLCNDGRLAGSGRFALRFRCTPWLVAGRDRVYGNAHCREQDLGRVA